jgi:hypothetical protein
LVTNMLQLKATVLKYCELSWHDLRNIKRWFKREEARDGFTLESFSHPSLRVAKAENSVGQTICLTPIESCYVVGAYITNPEATSVELTRVGDSIDRELERIARREGVAKFLIALPDSRPSEPGEKWIRVIEREVPQSVLMGGVSRVQTTAA